MKKVFVLWYVGPYSTSPSFTGAYTTLEKAEKVRDSFKHPRDYDIEEVETDILLPDSEGNINA